MSIVDEFKNIDAGSATGAGMFFFSMLAPGFLTIFLFEKELFQSLETIKLILLALSFSSPGVTIPIFISTVCMAVLTKMHQIELGILGTAKEWFYRHAISNAINMYLLIFISYIFSWGFSAFLWCFLLSILAMCAFEIRYMIKRAKEPSKYPSIELP
ncbi:MAG: hypothetical protein FHP94_00320 [Denitromonas halophila]|nr:MAG: hypothetical protein FHP94_00320 [Denitromonas halophila]TVT69218.1 MAG: hypothetical protein FHP93_13545 [Denitromonas halophila]